MTDVSVLLRAIFSKKMGLIFLLGISSGLPFLLVESALKAWMTDLKMDVTVIGFFSLVTLPYAGKFLWAPLLDRFVLPFLGRRRGWILVTQLGLAGALASIAFFNPKDHLGVISVLAFLATFLSATQDIVIDAYRTEILEPKEFGIGSSLGVYGYRIGMFIANAGALFLADQIPWSGVYWVMALIMSTGVIATLFANEPALVHPFPRTVRQAVIEPFREYFRRPGAWLILSFILLYKVGDQMAGAMTLPFYLQAGFTKTQVAVVVKSFGLIATFAGMFLGGVLILRAGIYRSLWVCGFLQAFSTLGFSVLTMTGPDEGVLAGVIAFENLSAGMGTAAFVAYMSSLCDLRFTATQYALLSSLMGVPRALIAAPTGLLVSEVGWGSFFVLCTIVAIPGLLLLFRMRLLSHLTSNRN